MNVRQLPRSILPAAGKTKAVCIVVLVGCQILSRIAGHGRLKVRVRRPDVVEVADTIGVKDFVAASVRCAGIEGWSSPPQSQVGTAQGGDVGAALPGRDAGKVPSVHEIA